MIFLRRMAIAAAIAGAGYSGFAFGGIRRELEVITGNHPVYLSVVMVVCSILLVATAIAAWMRIEVWPWMAIASAFSFLLLLFLGQLSIMEAAARAAERGVDIPLSFVWKEIIRTRGAIALTITAIVPVVLILSAITKWIIGASVSTGKLREAS